MAARGRITAGSVRMTLSNVASAMTRLE